MPLQSRGQLSCQAPAKLRTDHPELFLEHANHFNEHVLGGRVSICEPIHPASRLPRKSVEMPDQQFHHGMIRYRPRLNAICATMPRNRVHLTIGPGPDRDSPLGYGINELLP